MVTAQTPQGVVKPLADIIPVQMFGNTMPTGNSTTIALTFLPRNASTPVNLFALAAIERLNPTRSKKNGSSRGPAKILISPAVVISGT